VSASGAPSLPIRHDAYGYWLREAGPVAPLPALAEPVESDVVVIGGGYAGMWTAWHLLERGARVVVLEADRCGHGPSGRNGGFVDGMWHGAPRLTARFGASAALALGRAAAESVIAIGEWCEQEAVDAWYRPAEQLVVAAAPAQDGAGLEVAETCAQIGAGDAARAISAEEVQRRCASPLFRAGVALRPSATVQPARLALGLRGRLLEKGVRIYERSRVSALAADHAGVRAQTAQGEVRAGAGVLAIGCAALAAAPLARAFTGASSHQVITEPVPDVLEDLGWTGGEPITDGRSLVHYFRTTPDGRISFGWGGGPILAGARTHGRAEVDPGTIAALSRDLHSFFPMLAGRRIEHAWGGPIDASPWHLPVVVPLSPRARGAAPVWCAFGFTGNGVGPSHLIGRILARLAVGEQDELTALPIVEPPPLRVPPEPWRVIGGTAIRRAIELKERAEERGDRVGRLSALVADIPRRLGYHIGR
jgi:glycine/D-amino acid oxidase-like deaminating enzyme